MLCKGTPITCSVVAVALKPTLYYFSCPFPLRWSLPIHISSPGGLFCPITGTPRGKKHFSNPSMPFFTSEFPLWIVYTALSFLFFSSLFLVLTEVAEAPGRVSSHAVCSLTTWTAFPVKTWLTDRRRAKQTRSTLAFSPCCASKITNEVCENWDKSWHLPSTGTVLHTLDFVMRVLWYWSQLFCWFSAQGCHNNF